MSNIKGRCSKNSSFVQTGVDEHKNVVQMKARWRVSPEPLKLTVANLDCVLLFFCEAANPHGYGVSTERYTKIQICVFYIKQTGNSLRKEGHRTTGRCGKIYNRNKEVENQ